ERRPDSAIAFLQWEKKRIGFKIEVPNVNQLYVDQIRKDLESWPGFNYQNWQNAAQFCADNKINLDEALVWADKAIKEPFRNAVSGVEDFSTLGTRAAVLSAMGRDAEADATMDKAVRITGTPVLAIHQYGMRLLAAKRNDRALEIFKLNKTQHPDENFITFLGLARGYTALGDKENAIKNWELVLQNVPEGRKANIPAFQDALKKLKEGG
ncbi:MAG TPA: hypothetical protein VGN86_17495, partial [Pyrinomonadaceae bacterium]|nr:hypothetical protein [Pyrinomonadaceae bacterium]